MMSSLLVAHLISCNTLSFAVYIFLFWLVVKIQESGPYVKCVLNIIVVFYLWWMKVSRIHSPSYALSIVEDDWDTETRNHFLLKKNVSMEKGELQGKAPKGLTIQLREYLFFILSLCLFPYVFPHISVVISNY